MNKRDELDIFMFSSRVQKRGALEMSVGTIVIVVLSMSMLILGMILIKNIFSGANDVTDMTTQQVKEQVSKMFGEDKKLVVYPDTHLIEIKAGDVGAFGIGIKNLQRGSQADTVFRYEVVVSDSDIQRKCGVSAREAEMWVVTGRSEDNINIAPGEYTAGKARIEIPEGTSLCTFRYRINTFVGGAPYDSEMMDVKIKA